MSNGAVNMIGLILFGLAVARLTPYMWVWVKKKKIVRVYEEKHLDFEILLCRYNPYFKSLARAGRERFLRRLLLFIELKKFEYIDLEPEEIMPVLVSAAAVQLTFGLENFLLDYFHTIYLLKDKYRYGVYNMPFEGHVSEEGIYLSWNHFIREYTDYSDGQNVGLHEMAHALTYVNFTVQRGRDNAFYHHFNDFSLVARPIFERMQTGEANVLDSYAATNYQEFWAVCIETFFERSNSFRRQLPELYFALCSLLNQDPLTPEKILISEPQA
ncbi:MAG TPA: zinc-dependent peptidase [Puia sp.]|nr:zinc-dependent peptidase [Puia sp.]